MVAALVQPGPQEATLRSLWDSAHTLGELAGLMAG
jgi:hypothetical protein